MKNDERQMTNDKCQRTSRFWGLLFSKGGTWIERVFTPLEFPLFSLIMRHFAAENAGNWRFYDGIKAAVLKPVQARRFLPLFSLWTSIHS
jgi:hypothetical protein